MQVIFSGNWLPGSALIRVFTQARWHHCGVIMDNHHVIESRMTGGVEISDLQEFKDRGKWAIIDIPVPDEQKAIEFMKHQQGTGYDFAGIFAVLFVHRDWQDPKKWYCSELIAEACKVGGYPIAREHVAGVSPRDIWIQHFPCTQSNVPELITR